jgi:hypothetical protein
LVIARLVDGDLVVGTTIEWSRDCRSMHVHAHPCHKGSVMTLIVSLDLVIGPACPVRAREWWLGNISRRCLDSMPSHLEHFHDGDCSFRGGAVTVQLVRFPLLVSLSAESGRLHSSLLLFRVSGFCQFRFSLVYTLQQKGERSVSGLVQSPKSFDCHGFVINARCL